MPADTRAPEPTPRAVKQDPMSTINHVRALILAAFLGGLTLVVLGYVGLDVWVVRTLPPGSSISWSMAVLGYQSPISVYGLGFVCGGLFVGLPLHFWFGMPSPADVARMDQLADENAKLVAEVAALKRHHKP